MLAYETRPLPDHWENVPTQAAIRVRFRLPGVISSSTHLLFEFSISWRTAVWISANSAWTSALFLSPSPWYLTRISKASSFRSREISHLRYERPKSVMASLVCIMMTRTSGSQGQTR